MSNDNIKLYEVINALKNKWKIIVTITLLSVAATVILNFFIIKPKYQAYTKLFLGKEQSDNQIEAYNNSDVQMYQKLLKTYVDIIKTNDLIDSACKSNNIKISSQSVLSNLTVSSTSDTQILTIQYKDTNKERARDVIKAITEEFIDKSTEYFNASVKVVETVKLPQNPVSPNKKVNVIIGFLLGLIMGVSVVLVISLFDNTFKDKEEVEMILGLPVIGTIPKEQNGGVKC